MMNICAEFLNEFCNSNNNNFSDSEEEDTSDEEEEVVLMQPQPQPQPQNTKISADKVTIIVDTKGKTLESKDKTNHFCYESDWETIEFAELDENYVDCSDKLIYKKSS